MTIANPYGQQAVQNNALAFLAGRGFSAVLTFAAFALAARVLNLQDYGGYTAALALLELGLAVSTFGIDWVALRTVPEYRVNASGRATVVVLTKLALLQTLLLMTCGIVFGVNRELLGEALHMPILADVGALLGLLIAVEGFGRLMRDQMLGILMRQRAGQMAQVVRAGGMAGLLAWHFQFGRPLGLAEILKIELLAAAASAALGFVLLFFALCQLWNQPQRTSGWQPPDRALAVKLATHSYASYLLALAYGPQVITILIARVLGAEAVAIFGFARGFAEQVRRYLPTDLLQSVLRPAAVAYYSSTSDFSGLSVRLGLWLKSALIVLLPLLAFFTAFGALGTSAIGGHRFTGAWPIVVLLLLAAGTMAWRRITELTCNIVHASDICARAGLLLLGTLPVTYVVLVTTKSLFAVAFVFVCAEIVFNLRCQQILKIRGFNTQLGIQGYGRLLIALVATVVLAMLLAPLSPHWLVSASLTFLVSVGAIYVVRPLASAELALLSQWQPRLARIVGSYERTSS